MLKLNAKFDTDSLLCSLSHFECDGHTVHMLTQWCLPPPLTSTVKSSLFTHAHSSPLSLAARLRWCHANHSRYINNGWTLSRWTSYMCVITLHHISCIFLAKHQIIQVTQSLCTPHLVPCNFWLFPKLKSPLRGKRFQTVDEIQENTTGDWWWLGELCEVSRCLLWRRQTCHCPMYMFLVSGIFLNKCLYFS